MNRRHQEEMLSKKSTRGKEARFACGFLQIPPRHRQRCRRALDSPVGLVRNFHFQVSGALPGAPKKGEPV